MIYRMFRVQATSQWCAPMYIAEAQPDDPGELADRVAATLGLPAGSLITVDDEQDIRTGPLLEEPVPPDPPQPPEEPRAPQLTPDELKAVRALIGKV